MSKGETKVFISKLFFDALDEVRSQRTLDEVARKLQLLASFPDMGRISTSLSITSHFGDNVRTLTCGNYVLVYSHEADVVNVLALHPARLIVN